MTCASRLRHADAPQGCVPFPLEFRIDAKDYYLVLHLVPTAFATTYAAWAKVRDIPHSFLLEATIVSAWRGGIGPGLFATAFAVLFYNMSFDAFDGPTTTAPSGIGVL